MKAIHLALSITIFYIMACDYCTHLVLKTDHETRPAPLPLNHETNKANFGSPLEQMTMPILEYWVHIFFTILK